MINLFVKSFIDFRDYFPCDSWTTIDFNFGLRTIIVKNIVVISIITNGMMKPTKTHRDASFEIVLHLDLCPFAGSTLNAGPESSFLIPFSFYEYQSITCFYIL